MQSGQVGLVDDDRLIVSRLRRLWNTTWLAPCAKERRGVCQEDVVAQAEAPASPWDLSLSQSTTEAVVEADQAALPVNTLVVGQRVAGREDV